MPLLALGLNHKTAPVEIRERLVFPADTIDQALHGLTNLSCVNEAAILSTCNRTEIYCGLETAEFEPVINWLQQYHNLPTSDLKPYLYTHLDRPAVHHLLSVASGLDSLILGEPQILGQVKDAYAYAEHAGTTGTLLTKLFHHTFSVAKEVRTDTAIGSSPVSVAFAAVSLAKQIFGDLNQQTALLIGAGETIELAARHLHQQGIGKMIIANRSVDRAHHLASQFNGYALGLPEIPTHLPEADIVVSSTASPEPILHQETVKSALKIRRHQPIFMVDIAVPRDIHPDIAKLEDVYLYTVDDLHEVIEEGLRTRREAAEQAREIIDIQVEHYMGWLRSLDAVGTICLVRQRSESRRDEVLAKAKKMLKSSQNPEQALQFLAHTLTNKLIHEPCSRMRQAAYEGRMEILEAVSDIFALEQNKK